MEERVLRADFSIRAAEPRDAREILRLIASLAEYEKLADMAVGTVADLERSLFGPRPAGEAIVAERGGRAVGFALYFTTFSTFMFDTAGLAEASRFGAAAGNLLLQNGAGLACIWAGLALGRAL